MNKISLAVQVGLVTRQGSAWQALAEAIRNPGYIQKCSVFHQFAAADSTFVTLVTASASQMKRTCITKRRIKFAMNGLHFIFYYCHIYLSQLILVSLEGLP